jgi:hypothetical protein
VQLANERSQASSLQTLIVVDSNMSTRCNIEFLSPRLSEPIPLARIVMRVIGKLEDPLNSSNRGVGVHLSHIWPNVKPTTEKPRLKDTPT